MNFSMNSWGRETYSPYQVHLQISVAILFQLVELCYDVFSFLTSAMLDDLTSSESNGQVREIVFDGGRRLF
jgi:hypothetical protein